MAVGFNQVMDVRIAWGFAWQFSLVTVFAFFLNSFQDVHAQNRVVPEQAAAAPAEQKVKKEAAGKDAKNSKTQKTKSTKKKAAANDKKPPNNFLGRLIRNIFPQKVPARILPKRNKVANPGEAGNGDHDHGDPDSKEKENRNEGLFIRDYIDARAPQNSLDARLLRQVDRLMKAGSWKPAMMALQQLLDRKQDSLVRTKDGRWISLREHATQLLGKLPKEYQDAYVLQYGKPAEQLLEEALQNGSLDKVVDVATRYFHTPAGKKAANYVVSWHLDRKEYGMAARWMHRLMQSNVDFATKPQWQLKAAAIYQLTGDQKRSEQLIQKIEQTVGKQGISVAGRLQNPREWLSSVKRNRLVEDAPLSEWRYFFGNPRRTGTMAGGEPLLLPRWSHPTTHSHAVQTKIEMLIQSLTDRGRALIPAFHPLAVKNKIIFRTMRGVLVVDATTGRPLWETREGISAETILSGRVPTSSYYNGRARFVRGGVISSSGYSGAADRNPLTGLLFRNGTFGNLSSDGERLFVIEKHAILSNIQAGTNYSTDVERYDRFRRSWSTNVLAAYDLNTGRPLWEIGGRKRNEPFDLPLAGTYFFSTPVIDGGELFITGETQAEIRVFSINPQTGKVNWSQRIANPDNRIKQDFGRRWFTSQIAVSDGMLICPTTVGWLVAVNRTNHSVLWAHRYSKPNPDEELSRSSTLVQYKDLNGRWSPSAPVISQGYVVYTPSEDNSAICVRLMDGKRVWAVSKSQTNPLNSSTWNSNYLYLAGVFGERVVLVGTTKITAFSLTDGKKIWDLAIPPSAGTPSGMGVASGEHYHLPLSQGQLWSIDLTSGKLLSKLYLPDSERSLGNLTMYQGMLLSMTPLGITSFEQRTAIVEKIKERKAKFPGDAWALLKEVEMDLLKRDYPASLARLRQIQAENVPGELKSRYRQAMMETLVAVIRSDFSKHDREIEELARFTQSPEEKFAHRRLAAERFEARKNFLKAFESYYSLVNETKVKFVKRADNRDHSVSLPQWLGGRFRDLYQQADKGTRQKLDEFIAAKVKAVPAGNLQAEQQLCTIFGFHHSSKDVWSRLVEARIASGKFSSAEQLLLFLINHVDREIASSSMIRLGELYKKFGLRSSVGQVYRMMARRFPTVKLSNGRTAAEELSALSKQARQSGRHRSTPLSWGDSRMVLESSGTRYSSYSEQELDLRDSHWPYFDEHRFWVDRSQQQLEINHTQKNGIRWLVPLRGNTRISTSARVFGETGGHMLFVTNRNVLHSLSPVDRRVLWTRSLGSQAGGVPASIQYGYSSYSSSNSHTRFTMHQGQAGVSRLTLWRKSSRNPAVPIANARYVALHERRTFSVLDSVTGKLLWKNSNAIPGTRYLGTQDVIFIVPPQKERAVAVRAVDGKRLPVKNVAEMLENAISIVGNDLVLLDIKTSRFLTFVRETITLRRMAPLTGKIKWKKDYKTGTRFNLTSDGSLATFTRKGDFQLVDLKSGQSTFAVKLTKNDVSFNASFYLMTDPNNVILAADDHGGSRSYYNGEIASISLNGKLLAFDRQSGKPLWNQSIKNRQLVISAVRHSPVLVFSKRKYIRQGQLSYQIMSFLAIDKRTGKRLIDESRPASRYYQSLRVNVPERYVEFRTYDRRIRLVAVTDVSTKSNGKPNGKKQLIRKSSESVAPKTSPSTN
ncbi:MAG: hypothetical protein Tsb009_28580 [Planctomycetaceae bacterium]